MTPLTADAFLERFFGPGNAIDRSEARENPALAALVSDLQDHLPNPAVLPCRRDTQVADWFVLAGDDATFRRVQSDLFGFVGPTYARWIGARANLDLADPIENAVAEF